MASGDTLASFVMGHNEGPSALYATYETRAGAENASHSVLTFDDTFVESAEFPGIMVRNYTPAASSTVAIGWLPTSGVTVGTVDWEVAWKSITPGVDNLDSKTFATAVSVTGTAPGTSGFVSRDELVCTNAQMDAVTPGEYFRLRVTRNGGTVVGNAMLLFVEVVEV